MLPPNLHFGCKDYVRLVTSLKKCRHRESSETKKSHFLKDVFTFM